MHKLDTLDFKIIPPPRQLTRAQCRGIDAAHEVKDVESPRRRASVRATVLYGAHQGVDRLGWGACGAVGPREASFAQFAHSSGG
eukprot:scaffold1340_cov253-Pinguiococcus_pyrenoidosus.AAC.8